LNEANTYLDSNIYHVFADVVRNFDPIEHLERVCHPKELDNMISDCCYVDAPETNSTPPQNGVRRISTEWSAAFDAMPGELLQVIMKGIAENGTAPDFDRTLEPARGDFVKRFAQAQMVVLEDERVSDGWFYWTWKTEGGAYAEWDMWQGIREGWFPSIVSPYNASADVYGTCEVLMSQEANDTSIIHPFPWGDEPYWKQPPETNDDDNMLGEKVDNHKKNGYMVDRSPHYMFAWLAAFGLIAGCIFLLLNRRRHMSKERLYDFVGDVDESTPLKPSTANNA
jgi:hypothetical protein